MDDLKDKLNKVKEEVVDGAKDVKDKAEDIVETVTDKAKSIKDQLGK